MGESGFDFGAAGPSNGRSAVDIAKIIHRNRWTLSLGLIGGLLLGGLAYLKIGPEYLATSQVLVSKKASVPLKDGEARTFGERGEHIALIMSPMIVGKAVEMHKLNELPSLAGSKDPVEDILDTLRVKRSAGEDRSFLNVLDISYRNPRMQDAAAVVEAVIDAYAAYLADSRKEHTVEIVDLISQANDDLLKQLQAKQKEYLEFRESAPLHWKNLPGALPGASSNSNIHEDRVTAIETERRTNLLTRAEIRSKLKAFEDAIDRGESRHSLELLARRFLSVDSRSGAAAGSIAAESPGVSLDSQLLPLLLQEKTLERDFGPDHPDVQTVRNSIETVLQFYRQRGVSIPDFAKDASGAAGKGKGEIADLVGVYVLSMQQQLNELEHRDKELATLLEEETAKAKVFARYEARDHVYNEEIERIKSLWEIVVARLNELRLVKDSTGYALKQIAPVRQELSMKRLAKVFGAGTFLGILAAVAIVYLRSLLDTTLKTQDDVRQHFDVPVLGNIPLFKSQGALKQSSAGHPTLHPTLCYHHRPGSSEAEAYRLVRTSLLVCTGPNRERVLQISSPEPGDGKTTLASNLGIALAQSGKKVLLIDADLRRPNVHKLFNASLEIGMSDVLQGDVDLISAVQPTTVTGLSVLTAGGSPATPAELLSTPRFGQMLEAARAEFDMVLVDTPPLLAVSDSSIVAPQTDGLLLVVRLESNRRITVKRTRELIETHGIHLVGVVTNGLDARSDDAYSDKYAGYYMVEPETQAVNRKPEIGSRKVESGTLVADR